MVVRGSAWRAAICTSRRLTPASSMVVTNVAEHVWMHPGHPDLSRLRRVFEPACRRVPVHPRRGCCAGLDRRCGRRRPGRMALPTAGGSGTRTTLPYAFRTPRAWSTPRNCTSSARAQPCGESSRTTRRTAAGQHGWHGGDRAGVAVAGTGRDLGPPPGGGVDVDVRAQARASSSSWSARQARYSARVARWSRVDRPVSCAILLSR
jgi:hypothetical protein